MIKIYDLREDPSLAQMQEASLSDGVWGLSPIPFLIGTDQWWAAIDRGELPSTQCKGKIVNVDWRSMGDWPTFSIRRSDDQIETFTRKGDLSRYVIGLAVEIQIITAKLKNPVAGLVSAPLIIGIWLENSSKRNQERAPGPEGLLSFRRTKLGEVDADPGEIV